MIANKVAKQLHSSEEDNIFLTASDEMVLSSDFTSSYMHIFFFRVPDPVCFLIRVYSYPSIFSCFHDYVAYVVRVIMGINSIAFLPTQHYFYR
jgi:hypothetical protein